MKKELLVLIAAILIVTPAFAKVMVLKEGKNFEIIRTQFIPELNQESIIGIQHGQSMNQTKSNIVAIQTQLNEQEDILNQEKVLTNSN